MADKLEVAKELTLAVINKYGVSFNGENEGYNFNLANETAKIFDIIFKSISETIK